MRIQTVRTIRLSSLLVLAVSASMANAPSAARVGSLDYIEGKAFVDGQATSGNRDQLPILDNGQTLSTAQGHAEMLLTPGAFLRLDANTSVRLTNASLTDTQLKLDHGAAMLEVDNLHKDNLLRVGIGSGLVRVLKNGLYRFSADPAMVQVFSGQVEATSQDVVVKAGKHHQVAFSSRPEVSKFKAAADDDLSRWSRLRSEYEAEASVSSAQYAFDMGAPWGFANWFWNPWFDTWTWFPAGGMYMNPYGFGLFSPWMVYDYFPMRYYGARHFGFVPRTGPVSPSGLNLQRGAGLGGVRSGIPAGAGRPSTFYGAMRAPAGRIGMGGAGMGRSMGRGSMGGMSMGRGSMGRR